MKDAGDHHNNSKRRRTAAITCPLRISDLPDEALTFVSTYLPKPSVALLAVALTAPSRSWCNNDGQHPRQPSALSRAIISLASSSLQIYWGELDFEDVEKELAIKLTDDDLAAVLLCIDGVNKLKRLKLTGLVNITGRGLDPLRCSALIEQIDLSLVKRYEGPEIDPEPTISAAAVVPILDSIVSQDGNLLKHLQFPRKWKVVERESFDQFVTRYTQHLDGRPFNCAGCDCDCNRTNRYSVAHRDWVDTQYPFGLQQYTCYCCFQTRYCDWLFYCERCKKRCCEKCMKTEVCDCCNDRVCQGCRVKCDDCSLAYCSGCLQTFDCCNKVLCRCAAVDCYQCKNKDCNKISCSACVNSNNGNRCMICKSDLIERGNLI